MTVIDGVRIVNATPHEIRFLAADGRIVTIQPSGFTLPAERRETVVRSGAPGQPELVKTIFAPSEQGARELEEIRAHHPDVIVGSIISAQAYPGQVCGLVPVPGYDRAAPAEKLYRVDRFVIF